MKGKSIESMLGVHSPRLVFLMAICRLLCFYATLGAWVTFLTATPASADEGDDEAVRAAVVGAITGGAVGLLATLAVELGFRRNYERTKNTMEIVNSYLDKMADVDEVMSSLAGAPAALRPPNAGSPKNPAMTKVAWLGNWFETVLIAGENGLLEDNVVRGADLPGMATKFHDAAVAARDSLQRHGDVKLAKYLGDCLEGWGRLAKVAESVRKTAT